MIRKLRVKFILVSMFSMLLVLSVILGIVNVLNYDEIVHDADSVLALLNDHAGELPVPVQAIDWRSAGDRYKSPELPYEIRFFSAVLDDGGTVRNIYNDQIFAVDEAKVAQYAAEAFSSGETGGFVEDYRFARYAVDDGVLLTFLDCGRMLAGFRSVLIYSAGIAAAGMAAVFMLVWLLSGRMIRPIAESYRKQRRFITDAGHEIKTPITIIDADLEILCMETGDNEWVQDIRAQTARLAALTNDLICLSRMEEEEVQAKRIEFPFSDAVRETAESFQALARTRGRTLRIHVEPMLSYVGEEKSLCQLTEILLDNAIKYSREGDEVRLTLEKQGRLIRLAVDNGVQNLPKDVVDNMFDRFYRGDRARASEGGGYGIGLSIAQAIVSAHRGKISAAVSAGRLTMTVLLPAD